MIKTRDHISGNLEDYNSHTELKSCAYTLMLFNTDTLKRLNCQDLNIELFVRYQKEVIIYHKHRSKSNKGAKFFWFQQIYGLLSFPLSAESKYKHMQILLVRRCGLFQRHWLTLQCKDLILTLKHTHYQNKKPSLVCSPSSSID